MLTWWMWMILGLVLLACEMITPGTFFFMFLGISGLLTGLVCWMAPDLPAWAPWLLFSIFSAVSLAFFRKPLMEKFKLSGKHGHKVDSLVGENRSGARGYRAGSDRQSRAARRVLDRAQYRRPAHPAFRAPQGRARGRADAVYSESIKGRLAWIL